MLGSGLGGAGQRELTLVARERAAAAGCESGSVGPTVLFCVFPLSISLSSLFPLFAFLLNCPYPDPPISACFFLFSSTPQWGEGRPHGAFVTGHSQTITLNLARKRGAE